MPWSDDIPLMPVPGWMWSAGNGLCCHNLAAGFDFCFCSTKRRPGIGRGRPDGGGLLTAIVGVIKSGMAKARALR